MQIALEVGEDLKVVTPRGNVVIQWVAMSEDCIVMVSHDSSTQSKVDAIGQPSRVSESTITACRVHLKEAT